MPQRSYNFIKQYSGLIGYGLNKKTDQATIQIYLQKISDDNLMKILLSKIDKQTMDTLFNLLNNIICKNLNEQEYHEFFLKD